MIVWEIIFGIIAGLYLVVLFGVLALAAIGKHN